MAEAFSGSVVGIQRVILLFLIGSLVGRCVGSVSVHSGKLHTPHTVLSSGERGTLQHINMSDVCLCVLARMRVCVCVCSVSSCVVATAARSLNISLSSSSCGLT